MIEALIWLIYCRGRLVSGPDIADNSANAVPRMVHVFEFQF